MIVQQTGGIRRTTEDADEGENICEEKLNSKNSQALYSLQYIIRDLFLFATIIQSFSGFAGVISLGNGTSVMSSSW